MDNPPLKGSWVRTRAARSESLLEAAFKTVFQEQRPADQFLQRIFRTDHRIGGRDRRLYSSLIFAVFRWYGLLRRDHVPAAYYLAGAAAAEKIHDPTVEIFLKDAGLDHSRTEELFRGETPLERIRVFRSLAGITEPVSERDCIPEWVLSRLDGVPDAEFFQSWQTRSPLWLRVRSEAVAEIAGSFREQGLEVRMHERLGNALRLTGGSVNLPALTAGRQGWFEVQDLSSQCIGQVCAPEAGQCWWDACAGGGGKTLQLAALMCGRGRIFASDVRENKLAEIQRRAAAAGFTGIRTRYWDGGPLPVTENSCDGVLVDAPCSSSGRWRRNPEGRWMLTPERVDELAALQKRLLKAAAQAVKPGGVLVYATCSFLRDENRLNAEDFLSSTPGFRLESFPHPLTGATVPGCLQILPGDGDCDAAFIARFRKEK